MIKRITIYIVLIIMLFGGTGCNNINEISATDQYEKLWIAVDRDNEQAMIEAINSGADINKFEYSHCSTISPVIWACHEQNNNRFINTILKYNLDPNFKDISDTTVFCEAINERKDVYERLLELNPDVNFVDDDGNNVIYYAISSDNIYPERVQDIVDKGAVVTDDNIEYLIRKIKGYRGSSYHKIANIRALKILIENYYDDSIDKNVLASYSGNFDKSNKCKSDIVLYGIAGYCSKEILSQNLKGNSDLDLLLRIAVMADNLENAKYLIEQGANINGNTDGKNSDALYFAVKYNNYDMAKYIMQLNRDTIDNCVCEAVINNNTEILNLLLDNGANINNKEAFEQALIRNFDDIVKCFVERGFNVNTNDRLNTYIYYVWVFRYCDLDTVKYIHKYSNKLNDEELFEAVCNSVNQGNFELLLYLKDLDADFSRDLVYSSGSRGDSPLVIATWNGNLDIVKFLVENGAGATNYTEENKEFLVDKAKISDDIYKYLTDKKII